MADGRKGGTRFGQSHFYLQFVLFCSIITGINLHPGEQSTGNQMDVQTPQQTDQTDIRSAPDPVVLDPVPRQAPGYPANTIHWGGKGRPAPDASGQFEIWDVSNSPTRKIVTLMETGKNDHDGLSMPDATIFLEPGGRVRFPLPTGEYAAIGHAGTDWNGHDFGSAGIAVRYRPRPVRNDQITVLVIGAPDEPVARIEGKPS